uniref:Uncharacterized protein n=1 Tax=Ixodes ricinus TaxID=34613 RepID=A0A6B0TV66_IXORI
MLQTMQLFFILSLCSRRTTFLFPVAVMRMSMLRTTSLILTTRKPSMQAWSAQMGSISVTYTTAPIPLSAEQQPLPTSP